MDTAAQSSEDDISAQSDSGTDEDLSPRGVLTARQGRPAPFTKQLQTPDTSHNRFWLMQCKRMWFLVYYAKTKETRKKFQCCECNVGKCTVMPNVLRYITPNCIS